MKVVGIITEYNPFHNGHKHHISEAKKITGADYVIAVMSGDFVQRGVPAIIGKYDRSLMALNNGVDLVIELPVCYATGSAQYFALGSVALLNSLGIVDSLCFGSECGDIKVLEEVAHIFNNPVKGFQELIYSYIRDGFTYPAARARAAQQMLILDDGANHNISKVLYNPNNILAIEYIRALQQLESPIKPYTITRYNAHYHDINIHPDSNDNIDIMRNEELLNSISSATAIRSILEKAEDPSDITLVNTSVPQNVFDYFQNKHGTTYPITIEDFSTIIKYKLISESSIELAQYLDLSSDMADRIKNIDMHSQGITELAQNIKTKNITLTRVNRALIHTLLNIKKDLMLKYLENDIIYYARILGMRKEASHLIRKIRKSDRLPVITKVSRADKQLKPLGMQMLNQDIFATHLYNQNIYNKYKRPILNEYKHGICIV